MPALILSGFRMSLSANKFPYRRRGYRGEQAEHRINKMTVAKIRVRNVIQTRKNHRKYGEWKSHCASSSPKDHDPEKRSDGRKKTAQQYSPDQNGIRFAESLKWRLDAGPKSGELSSRQAQFRTRVRCHVGGGYLPFLSHIISLSELRISSCFFRPGNHLSAVPCMFIENVVVPKPQFERQV